MTADDKGKAPPGDHGQFGLDNATEEYDRLKDRNKPVPNPSEFGGDDHVEAEREK